MSNCKQVGFLLLDSAAHIYHALPIAVNLSLYSPYKVVIYTSTPDNYELIVELLETVYAGKHQCKVSLTVPSKFYRLTRLMKRRHYPGLAAVFRANLTEFLKNEVLLTTDRNLSYLMKLKEFQKKKFILLNHGAGENAYGFARDVDNYDFVLVYGEYFHDRLLDEKVISDRKMAITGYGKFDWLKLVDFSGLSLFDNDNKIVVYNPHFKPELSSWYTWGEKILEYFYQNKEWNLIFAPHVMLKGKERVSVAAKYVNAENIHVDLDSRYLFDMSYTRMADIYIGDVSSQVYEFIEKPRPCIFLNPHSFDWRGDKNRRMWHMGQVIEDIGSFQEALEKAEAVQPDYESCQVEFFSNMFTTSLGEDGKRGAEAIVGFLENSEDVAARNYVPWSKSKQLPLIDKINTLATNSSGGVQKILFHVDNNRYDNWLAGLRVYLEKAGYKVVHVKHNKVSWLMDFCHVIICHGNHDTQVELKQICEKFGIGYSIAEIGFFPQKDHFFLDQKGINACSVLMKDDLSWVTDKHIEASHAFADKYLQSYQWKGAGNYILAPLQLEWDSNIKQHSPYKTMQAFIDHVEAKFPDDKIIFKDHPLNSAANYKISEGNELVLKGDILKLAEDAKQVYGINSNSLYETSMMGIPTEAIGDGLLRTHAHQVDKLLAALVDQQIPIETKDFGYWLDKYANPILESHKVKGHFWYMLRYRFLRRVRRSWSKFNRLSTSTEA